MISLTSLSRPLFWVPWFSLAILSYFYVDLPITILFNYIDLKHHWLSLTFDHINHLGTSIPYLVISGFGFLWAYFIANNKKFSWKISFFFFSVLFSGILTFILKIAVGRARPFEFFSYHIYGFYFFMLDNNFWSFPSGHATSISAICTTLYLLIKKWAWLFLTLIFLVCLGRVITRAHYLSDVMIGAYFGFVISFWTYAWLREKL